MIVFGLGSANFVIRVRWPIANLLSDFCSVALTISEAPQETSGSPNDLPMRATRMKERSVFVPTYEYAYDHSTFNTPKSTTIRVRIVRAVVNHATNKKTTASHITDYRPDITQTKNLT